MGSDQSDYRFGRYEVRTAQRQLLIDGKPAKLTARAFDVLVTLMQRRERTVTKSELLDIVWPGLVVEENNLQVQISTLRKFLGPEALVTIPGRGYRFALTESSSLAYSTAQTATFLTTYSDSRVPSIAVLPLLNVSDDASNEYFADGLTEEILNVLAKVRGLRVASRTSAFYFKGKEVDLQTIAKKLNVATILEGSVRRSGKRVRITTQLIQASTDSHLWSATYDRDVEDVFSVQDDIARSVVKELRTTLLGESLDATAKHALAAELAAATKGRTRNAEAHRLLLQGRFLVSRTNPDDVRQGLKHFQSALAIDPTYALAWTALGATHANQAGYGGHIPVAEGFRQARAEIQRALDLEPELAEAHATLAWIRLYCDWDWKGAEASIRRALALAPENEIVLRTASIVAGNLGRREDDLQLILRAAELDPLNARSHQSIAWANLDAGNLDVANAALIQALELNPRTALTYFCLGLVCQAQGRLTDALDAFRREVLDDYRLLGITLAQYRLGARGESDTALDELVENFAETSPCQIAEAHSGRDEIDLAFEWLDRAFAFRDPRLVEIRSDLLLRNLRADPRWRAFLVKMGFPN